MTTTIMITEKLRDYLNARKRIKSNGKAESYETIIWRLIKK